MVRRRQSDGAGKDRVTTDGAENDEPTEDNDELTGDRSRKLEGNGLIDRRSMLKLGGMTAAAGLAGGINAVDPAMASRDVSSGDGYEIWTISGKEIYDLSDGEELSNILVDQTGDGACLTIRARNKSGWEVRNVGFVGIGQAGDGGNRFQFQVSTPSDGHGLIENVWASGKGRNGNEGTELGGIYIRSSHAGHIDIRHTYIEGFGNNAVYASAVGKDGGDDGSVALENCYHRDNTVSQFRIGSPGSVVRNCVGVLDDPDGDRGPYPGGTYNARCIWGKHFRNQRVENSAFYMSEDDYNWDGVFEARYIDDRSHGPEAVVEVVDCDVNADAPRLTGSTSNARVEFTNLGESPTVNVIQDGGVPMSPKMAARGERTMPPELPGADGSSSGDSTDSTTDLPRTLTIDGSDAGWTDYSFTVSEEIADNPNVGSMGDGDSIDGTTASGFVNGGTDGYQFSGEITDATVDGDATVLVDGQAVDFGSTEDPGPTIGTGTPTDLTDSEATLQGTLESLGGADAADVAFEWRQTGASSWTATAAETLSSTGSFSHTISGLSADTTYEARAVATASDGDSATASAVEFSTEIGLSRTLTIDGSNAGWTDYSFTVSEEIANNSDVGSLGDGDVIDGSTVTGFVNGGTDGYRFSGEIADGTVEGDATVLVDGEAVDPSTFAEPGPTVTTGAPTDLTASQASLHGTLESLGGADSVDVAFEWRQTGAPSWTATAAETLSSAGSFSQTISGLSADTTYEVRAVATASDGDTAAGSSVEFSTNAGLPRTVTIDGNDVARTDYEIAVSEEIENDPAVGSFGDDDVIDGRTVTGFVNGGIDGYRFSGEIVGISIEGDATVLVDGQAVDPNSLVLPNQLVFDANSQAETTYQVEIDGDVVNDPLLGPIESGDTVEGNTMSGTVAGEDREGFRFSGDLVSLELDGEASVIFEDNDG